MPGFDKFRKRDSSAERNNEMSDGFNDRLDNGMSDGFSDGFDDGFDDDFGNGMGNGFSDGFNNDFGNDWRESWIPKLDETRDDVGGISSPRQASNREKVDLKASFAALFKAISDRFTGKGKPARGTGVDGSDISFASDFDSAVDEGFAVPQDEQYPLDNNTDRLFPDGEEMSGATVFDNMPEDNALPLDDRQEYADYNRNDYQTGDYGMWEQAHDYAVPEQVPKYGIPDNLSNISGQTEFDFSDDLKEGGEDEPNKEEELPPEGSAGSVIAAITDALKKFRKRLPGFRPKVYVLPEPEYHPEQDGIGTPTLASDIRKILEEQNKPGETEQEWHRMRQYISTVSTDTRIRPGDIKQPENIGEVRAAQDELYDLINEISYSNEMQRSRIGVYEKPPEEDPYNYRGINDDRQFYADMDKYSFEMNTKYGFESEEKVDPGRQQAEMEYSRVYNRAISQQSEESFRNTESNGYSGFGDGFDDDFSDDFGENSHVGNGAEDDGFTDDFDDFFDHLNRDSSHQPPKKSRVRVKHDENPDSNAKYDDGFSDYRTKRSAERASIRRRRRG